MRATIQKGFEMREVKVKRFELLQKIKENRVKHIAEYREGVAGYKELALKKVAEIVQKAEKDLRDNVERISAKILEMTPEEIENGPGSSVIILQQLSFVLPVPVSHEKDYNQVISMLEMSVDEHLTIRSDEFSCYVMDDWDWKVEFENLTKSYAGKR